MKKPLGCNNIGIEWITSQSQWERLKEFAHSFNPVHEISSTRYPIAVFKREEGWKGYAQIVKDIPIVFSSWHTDPKICSPRDVVESMTQLAGWARIQYGTGMTCAPIDTKTFLPSVMERMGFRRMNLELYELMK